MSQIVKFRQTCIWWLKRGGNDNLKNRGETVVTSKCLRVMNEQLRKILASQIEFPFQNSEKTWMEGRWHSRRPTPLPLLVRQSEG